MITRIITVCAAAAVVGLAVAMLQARRAATAAGEAASLRAECELLRTRMAALGGTETSDANTPEAEGAMPGSPSPKPQRSEDPAGAGAADDLEQLFLEMSKGSILVSMGPILNALEVSPDQLDRALELIAQHGHAAKAFVADFPRNADPEDPRALEIRTSLKKLSERLDADLEQLLGSATFREFAEHRKLSGFWQLTSQLAGHSFRSDAPVTRSQAKALVEIMRQNATQRDGGFVASALDWEVTLEQASAILTPEQQATLENLATYTTSLRKRSRLIAQATREVSDD